MMSNTQETIIDQATTILRLYVRKNCDFVLIDGEKSVHFDFKKGRQKNRLTITYDEAHDLYDVKAQNVKLDTFEVKDLFEVKGVYTEDLIGMFKEVSA